MCVCSLVALHSKKAGCGWLFCGVCMLSCRLLAMLRCVSLGGLSVARGGSTRQVRVVVLSTYLCSTRVEVVCSIYGIVV